MTTPRNWPTASRKSAKFLRTTRWELCLSVRRHKQGRNMPITGATKAKSNVRPRNEAPVFVLGCGRSGTTLLYHMILSAGDFAVYRTESNAINLLEPRFGDLSVK